MYDYVKLDPELKLQILEKVGIYSNRFSIPEPTILLSRQKKFLMHQRND